MPNDDGAHLSIIIIIFIYLHQASFFGGEVNIYLQKGVH